MSPEQRNALCIELAVNVSDWMWWLGSHDYEERGYIWDRGESDYESACGTLASVGIYQTRPDHSNCHNVLVPPSDVRAALATKTFDEHDLNSLLQSFSHHVAFQFVDPDELKHLSGWSKPFPITESFQAAAFALKETGYLDIENDVGRWREKALPWLVEPLAINYSALPEVDSETVRRAWQTMPNDLSSYLRDHRWDYLPHDISVICSHQGPDGWRSERPRSSVATSQWNVPLAYALFRHAQEVFGTDKA